MEDANVVHFIGRRKPWNQDVGEFRLRFRRAYRAFIAAHFPETPGRPGRHRAARQPDLPAQDARQAPASPSARPAAYLDRFPDDLTVFAEALDNAPGSPLPLRPKHEGGGPVAPRAWQRMLSGRRLDLLDPSPLDVEIEDIAHGLAFVARWNGQTRGEHPYSVAEHSLLVEELYCRLTPQPEPRWRLAALLHDAPEYVIGDMISPVKGAVGPGLRRPRRPPRPRGAHPLRPARRAAGRR